MDLQTIRTRAREKLDETSAKFWSNAELDNYANKGYFKYWQWLIQAQHPTALKNELLDIVGAVSTIALPSDFIMARLVERNYEDRTEPLRYHERFDSVNYKTLSDNNNSSFSYHIEGSNLVLEPTPQISVTDGIKLTHFYLPTELSADIDVPLIPSLYHNLLVEYAVVQAKRKEENEGGGGTGGMSFLMDLKDLEQDFKEMIERSSIQRIYVQPHGSW